MQNLLDGDEEGYGGMELLNPQKKRILEALTEAIRKEAGELVYFLNWKDSNSQQYTRYTRELIHIEATKGNTERKERLENKIKYINQTQHDILIAIQPMYDQLYDKIADEIDPGIWFNNKLKKLVWLDLILGEREISLINDTSKENYRLESLSSGNDQRFQKKIEKNIEKKKKSAPKIIPPKDHKLMTIQNYEQNSKNIISSMEKYIHQYGDIFSIDIQDKKKLGPLIEKYFIYIFIQALIDTKIVFNIRLKGKNKDMNTTREDSLDRILLHFEGVIGQKITISPTQIKKRMLSNLYSKDSPIDLAYTHTISEDLLLWEKYLNDTYFSQKSMSVQTASIEILKEYNAQEGISDKVWEVLNPKYHIYKDKIENYQKHKDILEQYQQSTNSQDPYIQEVIQDIDQKISFAQDKKKQHTIFEEDKMTKPIYEDSLPKIRGKFMKTHQVSLQHRHLFDVVISKFLDFYGTKKRVIDAIETENEVLLQILIDSNRTNADYMRFFKQYRTKKRRDELFDQKRSQKMSDKKSKIIEKIWPSQGMLDI